MLPQPILAPWARLFASLALEVILVFALTALLARLVRSASGQRMIWRLSFVALAALVLAEFSGVGHSLLQHLRASPPASATPRAFVVTTSVSDDIVPTSARAPISFDVPVAPATTSHEKNRSPLAWWLPVLALAGLVWFGARRSFCALRLLRLGRQTPSDSGGLAARVQALGHRLGIRRRVRVKTIAEVSSPIAFGILRPTVGVPKDFFVRFTAVQQDAMLAHELAHIAACDAVWMLLADFVAALLWWHPGAWWARRNLRTASETAADEASLLLEDGPATLAECLVTLGDLLTRSPHPGGLGMAGFRFRSELGRRVERLLHLRGPSLKPWRGATAWLARLLVPAALLGLALAFTAWLLPPTAGAATLREAFQGSPLGLATTALLTADKNDAPRLTYKGKQPYDLEKTREAYAEDARTLLLLGKKLYDGGNTNEAEVTWRKVLELEPGNKVALDYLTQIGLTYSPAPKPAVQPIDAAIPQTTVLTNRLYVSNARQKIYQKLNSIRLESVMFDDVPLTQVLEQVRKDAKNRDPDKKGVNIISSTTADPLTAPSIYDTTSPPAGGEADIIATTVKIDPELRDVTLGQVLDILVKVADRPIKYSIEDWGVLFSMRGADNPVLHTRWYKVDPRTFLQHMKAVGAPDFGTSNKVPVLGDLPYIGRLFRSNEVSSERGAFLTIPTAIETFGTSIRTYFRTKGVTLDPPKSIIFNDRLGMLMVRATLADFDVIEQAVQQLNSAPDSSPRQDQALPAGFPAANTDAGGAHEETARTPSLAPPSLAPKPLHRDSADLRDAPPPKLHTRWYKVDPNTFLHGLKGLLGIDFLTNQTPQEIVGSTIRTYFQTAGVNLDPPKAIIFKDRVGMLMIRATLEDLDILEQAVQVLNTVPPQVTIEVKFCEVPENLLAAPGLKLQPAVAETNGSDTNAAPGTLTSILTPDQSRNVVRALEQKKEVIFLAAPRVTTPNDRQAQVKTVEVKNIVTGFGVVTNANADPANPPPITQPFEFGPVVDVVPHVEEDRQTIVMRVVAGLKEFVGYDINGANDLWDYVESEGANPAPRRPPPKSPRPVIRERQAISVAALWDGQTLVLASRGVTLKSVRFARLTGLPEALGKDLLRRGFGSRDTEKRALLIFITPTIVDPAGNAVHTDAELPARTNSVPPQLPPPPTR